MHGLGTSDGVATDLATSLGVDQSVLAQLRARVDAGVAELH